MTHTTYSYGSFLEMVSMFKFGRMDISKLHIHNYFYHPSCSFGYFSVLHFILLYYLNLCPTLFSLSTISTIVVFLLCCSVHQNFSHSELIKAKLILSLLQQQQAQIRNSFNPQLEKFRSFSSICNRPLLLPHPHLV